MAGIKAGDVVRLKTGGPPMTVVVVMDDQVGCEWFADNELKEADFKKAALELVPLAGHNTSPV